jgi:hypothetical protein
MTFDQSTTDGNGQSLNHAATVECGYSKSELEEILILVSGDQLTMDRIRSLRYLKQSDTWGNRFNWPLPLLGLFHLAMNYLKMFLKNHIGDASDISSVAGCNALLRRERISDQLPDFWSALDLIDDCLDAYILSLFMEEAKVRTIEDLETFLVADAEGEHPTWPDLVIKCSDLLKFNAVWKLRTGSQEDDRDIIRENSLLFIRHALAFRDFWLASKEGDIGRCIHRMDTWTCQFIGAGQHRYAHELMEIKCGFMAEYHPGLKDLIQRNWLVNMHGKPGKSMPVDMQQENMVLHLKELINPESSHNLEEFHRKTLAPLTMTLLEFKREMREDITDRKWGGHHTGRDTSIDVRHLLGRLCRQSVFRHSPGRGLGDDTVKAAKDWLFEGQVLLNDGMYWKRFLIKSLREPASGDDDEEEMEAEYVD